jgi:hypothetical protein
MDIEILGFLGFVFAATSLVAKAYERRTDVLHGSYIEGPEYHPARELWAPSIIDRLRWKTQNMIYLASIVLIWAR